MTVLDQAAGLRQMARRMKPRAQIIAITSGKGGVGKTNLAVNLATTLANLKRRVVLLDADLGLANADILCNVQPRYNLAHVVTGQRTLWEVLTPVPAGFSLVAGASGLAKMADLNENERRRITEELDTLQEAADVLIVDTGAGIGRNVLAFTSAADQIVVVTTPEPPAINDAYAVIKVLVRTGTQGHISLIVNQAQSREEAKAVYERITHVSRQFLKSDILFGGYVLADQAVSQAVRKRTQFVREFPHSNATKCVAAWANRLDHHVAEARNDESKAGFFSRLAAWWR